MIRIESPLLKREILAVLRTRRAFWLLVTVVLVSALLPLIPWPSSDRGFDAAHQARWVFFLFAFTQLTAVLVIVPAFTAASIAGERQAKTYELLYTTLLRPSSIVLSKLFSATAYLALLLITTLPVVSVLSLLGGVTTLDILLSYGITGAAVVSSTLVCLTVSMRSARTATSAVRCLVWVVFWNIGLVLLFMLFGAIFVSRWWNVPWMGSLVMSSPYFALGSIAELSGWKLAIKPTTSSFLYAAVISLGHFVYLLRRVRLPEMAASPRRERRQARRKSRKAKKTRRAMLTRILLRLDRPRSPIVGNPVFLKEIRSEFIGRPWYRWLLFLAPLALFVLIFQADEWRNPEVVGGVLYVAFSLVVLIVPGILATSIPREAEQGNLDFLRGTLIPFRSILTGKVWASLYAVSGIVIAAGLAICAAFVISGDEYLSRRPFNREDRSIAIAAVTSTIILTLGLAFTVSVAAFFTSRAKRSLGALLGTYGTLLASFLGFPLLVLLMFINGGAGNGAGIFLSSTTPFVGLGMCLFGDTGQAIGTAVLSTIIYGLGSGAFWFSAVNRFENERIRDL